MGVTGRSIKQSGGGIWVWSVEIGEKILFTGNSILEERGREGERKRERE